MLEKFRVIAKQKGQGIVEYAVLLAFIVILASFLFGNGGIKESVIGIFDDVVAVLSPEQADKKKMLTLADKLKSNFKFGGSWGVSEGKMSLKGNYICVYVTGDGTADIHVQGKDGNQGWYRLNPNLFSNDEKQFYDGILADLNLTDKSKWAPSYTETDSQWSNGYAVMYGRDGKVSYWNMDSSLNSTNFRNVNPTDESGRDRGVDKSWLYEAHQKNLPTSAVKDNKYKGMHTRITGITD